MREIKFRAFWIGVGMFDVLTINFLQNCGFEVGLGYFKNRSCGIKYKQSIDESLKLMQYTGINDRNGKEIYEGDIVKRCAGYEGDTFEPFCKCCIFWDDGGFALAKNGTSFIASLDSCEVFNRQIEVIGNIHENPKLLED